MERSFGIGDIAVYIPRLQISLDTLIARHRERDPAEVTIGMIIRAVDGPIALGDFGQPHQDGACDHEGQCVLLAIWDSVGHRMRAELDSYSLAAVAEVARGRAPWPGSADSAS